MRDRPSVLSHSSEGKEVSFDRIISIYICFVYFPVRIVSSL